MARIDYTDDQITDIKTAVDHKVKNLRHDAEKYMARVREAKDITDLPSHLLTDLRDTRNMLAAYQSFQDSFTATGDAHRVVTRVRHNVLNDILWNQDPERLAVARAIGDTLRDNDAL